MSTGSPGSGTEVVAFRVLRAAGLNPEGDLTRQGLGASESAGALKDGKVDAFFWSGGLPTAAVQDLAHSSGITIRMIPTGDLVPTLQREHGPLYFPLEVPPNAYPGVTSPVSVVGVANILVVNRSMPEQLAYDITRVMFEKQQEIAGIHPEARKLSLTLRRKGSPVDFIMGAALLSGEGRELTWGSFSGTMACGLHGGWPFTDIETFAVGREFASVADSNGDTARALAKRKGRAKVRLSDGTHRRRTPLVRSDRHRQKNSRSNG